MSPRSFLARSALLVAFSVCGGVLLAACDSVGADAPAAEADGSVPWSEMLDAVNAARVRGQTCGETRYAPAPPLVWNGRLEAAAAQHTGDMAARDFFGHEGSDGSRPGDRATRAGYPWRVVGENIARYQTTVPEVVGDWVESPGHCRTLMDPRFTEMGAASDAGFWTQLFGLAR